MNKIQTNKGQRRTRFFGIPLIMPYIRPYVPTVSLMIFLGILSSLADTIYPLFNSWALDHFVAERTLDGLPVFLLLLSGFLLSVIPTGLILLIMLNRL